MELGVDGLNTDETVELSSITRQLAAAKAEVGRLAKERHRLVMRGKTRRLRALAAANAG
jgi:hypothetical protein